jgi:hypothetical protein
MMGGDFHKAAVSIRRLKNLVAIGLEGGSQQAANLDLIVNYNDDRLWWFIFHAGSHGSFH